MTNEYRSAYGYSLASPGAKFAALPPPVKNTIRAEAGSAEITDIEKIPRLGRAVYAVHFVNTELYPPLYIAADGSLLQPDLTVAKGAASDTSAIISGGPLTGVSLAEIPPPVAKVIRERAPNAEIAYINKDTWGDRIVYIVNFKDPAHHPRLHIAADGTVLNEGPK